MSRATHIAFAALLVLGSLAAVPPAAGAPTIASVSPSTGSTNGGTLLNITGAGFVAGASVQLFPASDPARAVTLTSVQVFPTSIRGLTPPRSEAGTLQVRVVNPDGSSAVAGTSFTYTSAPLPAVTSVAPSSGPSNGGTTLVLQGTGFSTAIPPSVAIVTAGHVSLATVQSVNATTIVATTSAGDGNGQVVVTNPDGSRSIDNHPFTFLPEAAPVLTSLTPASGPANGGTKVTLTGTNLAPGATVRFGGQTAQSVGFVSPTELVAVTPAHVGAASDAVEVEVINPDGRPSALASAFTFLRGSRGPSPEESAFEVTSVEPAQAPSSGGTLLTVRGVGFAPGPGLRVRVGEKDAADVRFIDSTHLTAVAPACLATCARSNVSVINPDGTESWSLQQSTANTFTYSTQVRFTLSKDSVPTAGGTKGAEGNVSIVATAGSFKPPCKVYVGGVPALNVTACSSFLAPPGPAGSKDVTVVGADGVSATLQGGLGYTLPPTPMDLTTFRGVIGSNGRLITLTGSGFIPVKDPAGGHSWPVVRFGDVRATVVEANATRLRVLTPPYPATAINQDTTDGGCPADVDEVGPVEDVVPCVGVPISVANIDGQSDSQPATTGGAENVVFGYMRDPPATLNTCVTRKGNDTLDRTPPILGGGVLPCAHASTDGGQRLVLRIDQGTEDEPEGANTANATTGMFSAGVVLQGSDGKTVRVGGTRVTVGGNPATVLDIRRTADQGNRPANEPDSVSAHVNDTMVILVPPTTRAGAADVVVINPDGTTSSGRRGLDDRAVTGYYRYDRPPAPVLQQPDVVTGSANGGTLVTLNAASKSLGPGATVFFGNAPVKIHFPEACGAVLSTGPLQANCVVGPTAGGDTGSSIRVLTPGHAAGTVDVRVVNADGQAGTFRNGFTFVHAAPPSLHRVEPDRAAGLGGQAVTLVGTDFATGSTAASASSVTDLEYLKPQVFVDGIPVPSKNVTVVSRNAIQVRLPDHGPGRVDVRVVNPDGQSTTLTRGFRYLGTPTAASLSPTVGPANGGILIGVAGKGFDPNSPPPVIRFRSQSGSCATLELPPCHFYATGVAVASPTLLVATLPPAPLVTAPGSSDLVPTTGPVRVEVIDQDGQTLSIRDGFTYTQAVPPSFSSLTPSASSVNGGASVTMKGAGFSPATKVCIPVVLPVDVVRPPPCADVRSGLLDSVRFIDSQTLRFVTPSGAAGPVDVCVINPQAAAVGSGAAFCRGPGLLLLPKEAGRLVYTKALSPILTSVDPTSGDVLGGTRVTLHGANLADVRQVLFDTAAATNVSAAATAVTAVAPPHAAGPVGITVISAAGLSYTLPQAFTYTGNATVPPGNGTTPPGTTSTTTTTTPSTTPAPGTVTEAQIAAANRQVTVRVTRDGGDNLVSFTLPLNLPATPQGVQVFRSNSPFGLLQTLDRTSAEYKAGSYRDVGAPADSRYLVTVYYANGQGKATSSPDEIPGFDQLGEGVAAAGGDGLPLELVGYVVAGALGLLLVTLLVVLVARRRQRADVGDTPQAQEGAAVEGGEGERHAVNCPNCGAIFEAVGAKPLRMECPSCGKTGILR